MQFHPVASIFPMMSVEEFKSLKESIQARGQRNPIYTHEGKIVDGRNRYQACIELGIHPRFEQWDGVGMLCDFVWDMNASRRQLTGGALRIAAGRYAIEHTAERQRLSDGRFTIRSNDLMDDSKDLEDFSSTRKKAAEKFKIGEGSVQRAMEVIQRGVPELAQAVESDRITVNKAAEIARKPKEQQPDEIAREERKRYEREHTERPDPPLRDNGEIKLQGVGVFRAHEAINCLKRIPKNDALRKEGFKIVTDWIRHNQ